MCQSCRKFVAKHIEYEPTVGEKSYIIGEISLETHEELKRQFLEELKRLGLD